jgi:hypothetical protein
MYWQTVNILAKKTSNNKQIIKCIVTRPGEINNGSLHGNGNSGKQK